jgi:hypothetical protein
VVFTSWRGVVGVVKPTQRPGSLEEFIRLLPEGVGVVPVYLDFKRGTEDEFRAALNAVHEKVDELAQEGGDLIHPEGAPPFMVHGFKGEEKIVNEWEAEFKIPIVTAAQTQVEALRALGVKKFVGVTYFVGSINDMFTRYFQEAGFRSADDERDESRFRRRRSTSLHGDLRAHAAGFPFPSGRRWHLYARYRLALPGHHSFARRRFAGAGGSRRAGPRLGGAEAVHIRQKVKGFGRLLEETP